MLKNINILIMAIYLIILSAQVYAGGFYTGSRNFAVKHKAFSRHISNHTRHVDRSFSKLELKTHEKRHHKIKGKNKIYFPYYVYDPYYASYGKEEDSYVEINITNDKKDEKAEPTDHKDKTFSPPHIVNWEDDAPNKSENVILIRGTKVNEQTVSSE